MADYALKYRNKN